jgi:group I intron endonuclease
MFIYLITNEINGKYYVGKTVSQNLNRYLANVKGLALHDQDNRPLLHRAIRKYGVAAFTIESLTSCETNEQASNLERLWIIALNSRNHDIGYNIAEGGEGTLGVHPSAETRAKLSAASKGHLGYNKGIPQTQETRQKIREATTGTRNGFYGKTHTDETRQKVALANSRRIWSVQSRERMSRAKAGFHHTEQSIQKMKDSALNRWRDAEGHFVKTR